MGSVAEVTDATFAETVLKSSKLANVCYDIRGPVLARAKQMEDDGQRIIGRRVSPAWVATTLAADAPKLTAAQVHALVLEGKTVVTQTNSTGITAVDATSASVSGWPGRLSSRRTATLSAWKRSSHSSSPRSPP